METVLY